MEGSTPDHAPGTGREAACAVLRSEPLRPYEDSGPAGWVWERRRGDQPVNSYQCDCNPRSGPATRRRRSPSPYPRIAHPVLHDGTCEHACPGRMLSASSESWITASPIVRGERPKQSPKQAVSSTYDITIVDIGRYVEVLLPLLSELTTPWRRTVRIGITSSHA